MSETDDDRHEAERLIALMSCNIMDTPVEGDYDHLTELAQLVFDAPIVLITLLDSSRLWFKSARGVAATEIPREQAFCRFNLDPDAMLVANDLLEDERFANNRLVTGHPHVRFYAGAPLVLSDGFVLGSFCVLDNKPRTFSEREREMLRHFARLSVERIELHRRLGLDWLTGALSKSALQSLSQEMLVSVAAKVMTASAIAIDIDHFKAVNDTYGHHAGDRGCAVVLRVDHLAHGAGRWPPCGHVAERHAWLGDRLRGRAAGHAVRAGRIKPVDRQLALLHRLHARQQRGPPDALLRLLRARALRHDGDRLFGQPVHAVHLL